MRLNPVLVPFLILRWYDYLSLPEGVAHWRRLMEARLLNLEYPEEVIEKWHQKAKDWRESQAPWRLQSFLHEYNAPDAA